MNKFERLTQQVAKASLAVHIGRALPVKSPFQQRSVVVKPKRNKTQERRDWELYRKLVWNLTNQQPLHDLENIERRGFRDHHLDHIFSIWKGWKQGILPIHIADRSNLRMLPYKENMHKSIACESGDSTGAV